MNDNIENIHNSIIKYWESLGFDDNSHLYCKHCGKLMLIIDELDDVVVTPKSNFVVIDKDTKKVIKGYVESLDNRFLVKGKNLSGKIFFRQLCWDCFHEEMKATIKAAFSHSNLHTKRCGLKYSWHRKLLKDEIDSYYPLVSNSATFYFKFLFGLTDEELEKECRKFVTADLDHYREKYGDEQLAKEKYNEYRKLQAKAGNTLDYFVEKYGKDKGAEKYNEVCAAKAVTKKNSIEKYGFKNGLQLFEDYCNKQAVNGNKIEYFVQRYGEEEGKKTYDKVCHQKALTLQNFIRKYGEKVGKEKYTEYMSKVTTMYSQISQKLFRLVDERMGSLAKGSRWQEKNGEAEIEVTIDGRQKFAKPDYLLGAKIIEFNGDFWHMNPKLYSKDETRKCFGESISAKECWEYDRKRIEALEKLGYQILVIWENEVLNDIDATVSKCYEFLCKRHSDVAGIIY